MQHLKSNKDEDENSKLDISTNDGKMVQEINSDIEKQVRSENKKDDKIIETISTDGNIFGSVNSYALDNNN